MEDKMFDQKSEENTKSTYDGYKDPVEGHEGGEAAAKPLEHQGAKSPITLHGGEK